LVYLLKLTAFLPLPRRKQAAIWNKTMALLAGVAWRKATSA